jgi:phenylacetate-CoA ligase
MTRHVDYPVADYEPMAGTALTDSQRWPLLTERGAAMLTRLREHPHAPKYNHACGDRLTAAARDSLRAYRSRLDAGPRSDWLPELISRVYRTVPRYRTLPAPASLTDISLTDRYDLLSRAATHVPDDADLTELIVYRTSGSRGPAATVPMTPRFSAQDLPAIEHILATLGVSLAGGPTTVAMVNVYAQPVAYQFASVSTYLDGAGVAKINLHESAWRSPTDRESFLDSCAPQLYTGNPISLAELATLPLRTRPKAILSGALALNSGLRTQLENHFDCPVIDLYGITEVGLIAWRADNGPHHLLPRDLHVEILTPAGEPCEDGTPGELVVTCGENELLPLLRYRTGDHAARTGTDLHGLEGRAPVRFRAESGNWVQSLELTHVLSPLGLAAWQLTQHETGAITLDVHEAGAPDPAAAKAAVKSLLGNVPVTVTITNLARDAKPQRYTSTLPGAELR